MKMNDPELRDLIRQAECCQWCFRFRVSDVHHIYSKGAGQVDIRGNLIALCRTCHNEYHAGHILRAHLLAMAAKRENTTQDKIRREVWRIRRLPKEADPGPGYVQGKTGWVQVDHRLGRTQDLRSRDTEARSVDRVEGDQVKRGEWRPC